jgi:hypothetical protein
MSRYNAKEEWDKLEVGTRVGIAYNFETEEYDPVYKGADGGSEVWVNGKEPKKTRSVRKATKAVKKSKIAPKGVKKKTVIKKKTVRKKAVKKVSERAVYGRLKKLLADMPHMVKITAIRKAYKDAYKADLKLGKATKDRLLIPYEGQYENLIYLERRRNLKLTKGKVRKLTRRV